jgi:serine/threonine protein kinase
MNPVAMELSVNPVDPKAVDDISLLELQESLWRLEIMYENEIGNGGQGRVLRCDIYGKKYAVKLFHRDAQSFEAEKCALYALRDHPNVIRIEGEAVLSVGDERYGVIIMELGLACIVNLLDKGPLDEATARKCAFEMLTGLSYMHSIGISHNDIKPDNLLVGWDGRIRIADFGHASRAEEHSRIMGTWSYNPPEKHQGAFPSNSCKADVWAAAVTIFMLLMGCWAFGEAHDSDPMFRLRCENFDAFWEQKLRERSTWLKNPYSDPLSSEAKSFIEQAMCVNPTERKSVAELLEHAWFRTLQYTRSI